MTRILLLGWGLLPGCSAPLGVPVLDTGDAPFAPTTGSLGTRTSGTMATGDSGTTAPTTPLPTTPCAIVLDCAGATIAEAPATVCEVTIHDASGASVAQNTATVELTERSGVDVPKSDYAIGFRTPITPLLPRGQTWRYWDRGTSPPADWASPSFDDAAWLSGPAPLGYGDLQATVVGYGPDPNAKYVTTWFRTEFVVIDPGAIADALTLELVRDDGARVLLNGAEIARSGLPDGDVAADALALVTTGGADELHVSTWPVDPSLLVAGTNVLAAEVHQAQATSSDLTFDAGLVLGHTPAPFDLYGMGSSDRWWADGAWLDATGRRNRWFQEQWREWGHPPSGAVTCTLELDGAARGTYHLGEHPTEEAARLNVSVDASGTGFVARLGPDGFQSSRTSPGIWRFVSPDPFHATQAQIVGASALLTAWEDATLARAAVLDHVDLATSVDWVLLQELAANVDAWQADVTIVHRPGGRFEFVPWAMELGSGTYPETDCDTEGWLTTTAPRTEMVQALADDPTWHAALVARWAELRAGPLANDAVVASLSALGSDLDPLNDGNTSLWPLETLIAGTGAAGLLCPLTDVATETGELETWLLSRMAWMDAHVATYREGI